MKTAELQDEHLAERIFLSMHMGSELPGDTLNSIRRALVPTARTLRRAQLTLHRWAELQCGDGIGHIEEVPEGSGSWRWYSAKTGAEYHTANREAGALRRVAEVCKAAGLHYYHQTDPRWCALYVSTEPLTDQNYSRGVACCL